MAIDNRITVEKYAALMRAFNNKCALCGNALNVPFEFQTVSGKTYLVTDPNDTQANLSHIDAQSNGGSWNLGNLFLAHGICNRMQQDLPLDIYCELIRSFLSFEQILETTRLAVELANLASREVYNFEVCQVLNDSLNLRESFPRFFLPNRMSNNRLRIIEHGARLYKSMLGCATA